MKHTIDWVAGATIAIALFLTVLALGDIVSHILRLIELTRPIIG